MKVRPNAEFRADFPSDLIEDDDGIVRFGGHAIAEAIAGMLRRLGYEVITPIYAGEHGWEFDARIDGRRYWLQVTDLGESEGLLMTENMAWNFWPFRSRYGEFLLQLDAELRRDGRFSEIRWLTKDWWRTDAAGTDSPVED
ncbi:MAG: hypothetical protein CGW95_06320 [Phenylobacterium zucineum]|nr:MAG: hypothetical protein CGW95_06320 [Phenylobacterium zucineum]